MKRTTRRELCSILLGYMGLLGVLSLSGCSYEPEDPGQCRLLCGSSIIAGNDSVMSIKVKSLTVATECTPAAVGATIGPYRSAFLIGEEFKDEADATVGVRPVPNISIEPFLVGTRPQVGNENDSDIRYRGLLTLSSSWCSDSCGVVTLDTASVCPGVGTSNDLSIQIHSGALFSEPMTFPISTPEPN